MNHSLALVGTETDIGLRSPAAVSPEFVVEIKNHERPVSREQPPSGAFSSETPPTVLRTSG